MGETREFSSPRGHVQSVQRAFAILRALSSTPGQKASLADLAQVTGLNRTTAWRLLMTLVDERVVALDQTGSYGLGNGLFELTRAGEEDIIETATPTLHELAAQSGETAALAMIRDSHLTYVAEAVPSAVVAATWKDRRVPLHATSTGKILLAFGNPDELSSMLEDPLTRFTESTITDGRKLAAEIDTIRAEGYATCRGEYERTAYGVSAPIFGPGRTLQAVLSIWGPAGRVQPGRFQALGEMTLRAAHRLHRS